jgi:hypothetical protein
MTALALLEVSTNTAPSAALSNQPFVCSPRTELRMLRGVLRSNHVSAQSRPNGASGERGGAVKAGAAAERSDGSLDGHEHSPMIDLAGEGEPHRVDLVGDFRAWPQADCAQIPGEGCVADDRTSMRWGGFRGRIKFAYHLRLNFSTASL